MVPLSLLTLLLLCTAVKAQDWEEVQCEYDDTERPPGFCECTGNTGSPDPICHFTLEIEQLHTFTRYILDGERRIPGFGGRVMYFETQGEGQESIPRDYPEEDMGTRPAPTPSPANQRPSNCQDNPCTDPFTVDGNSFRSVITVNGRFPAPTLIVPYRAVMVVDVSNMLDSESTSIHWHGMHQMNTPWMDGVEHITQCGISPASSFRYIFRAFPAGTHWYHSHSGAQRTDGLFGALIVRESMAIQSVLANEYNGLMDIPQNNTITLLDWQPKNSLELFTQLHSGIRFFDQFTVPVPEDEDPNNPFRKNRTCSPDGVEVGPVNFWSGLINGRGRHKDIDYDKTYLSVFTIRRNERHRFRLIGAQGLFAFRFSIDEHRLQLIATDGHFVVPEIVDFIIIHSGERYDFIPQIINPSSAKRDFIIRAETLEVKGSSPERCANLGPTSQLFDDHMAEAILHYDEGGDIPTNGMYKSIAENSNPRYRQCRQSRDCMAVNCPFENFPTQYGINCLPIDRLRVLPNTVSEMDQMMYTTTTENTIFFNFGFEGDSSTSAINGRNFRFPSEPLELANNRPIPLECQLPPSVSSEVCNNRPPNQLVTDECRCTHIRRIDPDQTYRFVFTAVGPDFENWNFAHPVHLHGHSFRVTKVGFGTYNGNRQIMTASSDIRCARRENNNMNNLQFCANPTWSETADSDLVLGRNEMINNAPFKDTVLVPAGGYAVVYFRSNNPGYWFLHCHIEVHQLEGMAVVINEAPNRHNSPPLNIGQCQPFTWSVSDFLKKERSPAPALQLPSIEYNTLFVLFVVSAVIAGALIGLFVLLLIIIACITCCYCCRK